MSGFYKATRHQDWNYGGQKWRLSRSKIELFVECPRCFYIDNKLGVTKPKMPPFNLNIAVDKLLKKEFDAHREAGTSHPIMKKHGLDLVPFVHKSMNTWRENFEGVDHKHEATGLTICGAVDDIWVNKDGELTVVDYKATSKDGKIESLEDSGWEQQYRRQMGVYQWLLRKKGFKVSDTGYFFYVNGLTDKPSFDGKLEFESTLIPITGTDAWIEQTLLDIKKCLDGTQIPPCSSPVSCDYCKYINAIRDVLVKQAKNAPAKIKLEEAMEAIENTISPKPKKSTKLAKEKEPKREGSQKLFDL